MKYFIKIYGKRVICVLLSVFHVCPFFAPAGYAVDAEYDRSSESLQAVMELYDKKFRDVKSARYIETPDQTDVSAYSRAAETNESTSVRLTFDDNLVVELVDDVVESVSNFEPITDDIQQVYCLDDLNQVIDSVEEIAGIGEGYSITYSEEFDEDYWRLTWEKSYNGIVNPYESVNAVVNRRTLELVTYRRFDEAPSTLSVAISEDEALVSACDFLAIEAIDSDDISCEVAFTKANVESESKLITDFFGNVRIAYHFALYEEFLHVYVDAVTGEVMGYTESRDSAKAFSVDDRQQIATPQFADPWGQTGDAGECFAALGYNVLSPTISGESMRDSILNFLNRSDAYAFYIACHGVNSLNPIGANLYHNVINGNDDSYKWRIYANEISGNWKFVFLDACQSAQYTTFADSFNIYSSSTNRAFLGWTTDVLGSNCNLFTEKFFPEVVNCIHSNNIRDAAVWAASQVPGSGTTPIRFIGDRTYDGRLY